MNTNSRTRTFTSWLSPRHGRALGHPVPALLCRKETSEPQQRRVRAAGSTGGPDPWEDPQKSDPTHRKHPPPPPSITMPQISAGRLHPGLQAALRVSGAHLPAVPLRHLPRVSAGLGSRASSASLGSGKHFLEHHTPQSISSSPHPPQREGGKGKPRPRWFWKQEEHLRISQAPQGGLLGRGDLPLRRGLLPQPSAE